jgi:hypothetical protein
MVEEFSFPLGRKLNYVFYLNLFVTAFLFCVALYVCSKGLEFTDEGYYLQSIAYPDQFDYGVSQFGFFLHPFYTFFASNVVLLRVFNVLSTVILSFIFCLQIFRSIFPSENRKSSFLFSLSFIFSISSLSIFSLAIFTPSHNSLNFQICIMFAIIMNFFMEKKDDVPLPVFLILGILLSISCLNKLSTGLILIMLSVLLISMLRFHVIQRMLTTIFGGFSSFLLIAYVIDGNLVTFTARLRGGLKFSQLMGHDFVDVFKFYTFHPNRLDLPILAVAGIILLCTPLAIKMFHVLFILIALGFSGLLFSFIYFSNLEGGQFKAIWIAGIPLFLIFQANLRKQWSFKYLIENLGVVRTSWCLILFLFPLAFAIGTNNNYWEIGSWVSMFSLLAGFKALEFGMFSRLNQSEFLVSVSVSTLLVAFVFLSSISTPYRQDGSLFNLNTSPGGTNRIAVPFVSAETSRTIYALKHIINGVDPKIRRPLSVLDLTGQSPGLIFAVGGKTIGQPWLAGGYPGSEAALRWVLSLLAPCERTNSLVLVEEHGSRSLSTELLSKGDWNFERDYRSLGSFQVTAGTGFHDESRKIELFQPNDSVIGKFSRCY